MLAEKVTVYKYTLLDKNNNEFIPHHMATMKYINSREGAKAILESATKVNSSEIGEDERCKKRYPKTVS